VGHVEADAVDGAGLTSVSVFGVDHLHGVLLAHVPQADKAVSSCTADERHVVVSGEAVDGLVERLFPGPVRREDSSNTLGSCYWYWA